jgi:hypothetical protein
MNGKNQGMAGEHLEQVNTKGATIGNHNTVNSHNSSTAITPPSSSSSSST